MSENPFAHDLTTKRSGLENSRTAWVAAGLMFLVAIVVVLLWASAVARIRRLESLRPRLEDAAANLSQALSENKDARTQIAALQTRVSELEKEKDTVGQNAKRLEDEMRSELESKDVTISKLQGKLTVNILDRVMFDSGEATLKPAGEAVLQKIASILAEHPELKIHVIGHTDNVPIRARFSSNWELSTARALAAVHFLTERAGVTPARVGAVGYGEYRPIADNSTSEGRAKNRRIAITILPNELAEADIASPTATNSTSTNALPVSVAP
jgi:chemotaxis protein MotB